jgi:hypothetical protein
MNMIRTTTLVAMLATLPLAGACSQQKASATDDTATMAKPEAREAQTVIGKVVEKEIAKAREKLRAGNITIGGDGVDVSINGKHYAGDADDGRPRAEITPKGDLLVDGKAVATTPAQRAMLLEYRGQVIGVAEAGMVIGSKAADLAGSAIKESLGAVFSGDADAVEKRVEAKAMKLKDEARVLCTRLPPMLAAQQRLAASLPEFKPYATMTQDDVDDCAKDIEDEGAWSTK